MQELLYSSLIELYIEQELAMARLYKAFAGHFQEQKSFWQKLVSEEYEHAAWIKHFRDSLGHREVFFSEGKTRAISLQSSISYIRSRIEEFEKTPFSLRRAVSISLDIEKSLLERDVIKHFDSDSPELRDIMDILVKAQDEHIKKVESYLAALPAS